MKRILTGLIAIIILGSGCQKANDWLDIKQNKNAVVPTKLADFQALLDNTSYMNKSFGGIAFAGCDNYYVTDADVLEGGTVAMNVYLWAENIFEGNESAEWQLAYRTIGYANACLGGLKNIPQTASNTTEWNNVRGGALFFRAYTLYNLLQCFAKPFDAQTSKTDPAVPIRLTSDVNVKFDRSNVAEAYSQIISDLNEAENILPELPAFNTRASKLAARALLAKLYLNNGDYSKAADYAEKVLAVYDDLYQFTRLDSTVNRPFPALNNNATEIIFYGESVNYGITSIRSRAMAPLELYNQYKIGDLRRCMFFTKSGNIIRFKGTYTANNQTFGGIGVNEIYLAKAEALVRLGRVAEGITALNDLLKSRFAANKFVPYTPQDADRALLLVLTERRKELPFTGQVRWEDLRRLNKEGKFTTTLTRTYNGTIYTLPPNDPRYVYPIPDEEVRMNDLEQNIRH